MERSGTLAEPSDNSTTPYIKKETNPFGSASLFVYGTFRRNGLHHLMALSGQGENFPVIIKNLQRAPFIT